MTSAPHHQPSLDYIKEGAFAFIVANNPARLNAMTAAMWKAVPDRVAEAARDPDVRAIILRGQGAKAFSAGADISEFEGARTGDAAKHYDALNDAAFNALMSCAKPVIAMIHGHCLGGGLAIALCADIRICDDAAQFAIPAAKLGIGYNARWVRPLLAAVSPAYAKEILFTGRRIPASEARDMGLVSRIVAPDHLEAATRQITSEIAANAPLSVMASKRVVDELVRRPENPDLASLDRLVAACFDSEDYAEGRRAFLEKRQAEFKGR